MEGVFKVNSYHHDVQVVAEPKQVSQLSSRKSQVLNWYERGSSFIKMVMFLSSEKNKFENSSVQLPQIFTPRFPFIVNLF